MPISFRETAEFQNDVRRLVKKYKSLAEDLELFKTIIAKSPFGFGAHFHIITKKNNVAIIKARLFCRYLRGKTLRIIYAYSEKRDNIEIIGIFEFIELYFKGEKENEDSARIKEYLKK
ncbi:MAG: hypothetical protein AAB467_05015 [Patescibacteria group bacterium]